MIINSRSLGLILAAALGATAWAAPAAAVSDRLEVLVQDDDGNPVAGSTVAWSLLPTFGTTTTGRSANAGHRTAAAGATGRASLVLSLTATERSLVARNGDWANIEIAVADPTGRPIAFEVVSRYLGHRPDQASQQTPISAADPLVVTTAARMGQVAALDTGCTNFHWETYRKGWEWTRVGELHSAGDTRVAKFTYGKTADSDVDVGYRTDGSSWTISGSTHVGNSRGSSVSISAGSNYGWGIETQFNYNLDFFYADCYQGSHRYQGHQRTYATSWRGSITNQYDLSSFDNKRNSHWNLFGKAATFDRSTYDFKWWSAAATAWGASLGAQSGASTFVRLHYEFGTARSAHYLYGNNDTPPYAKRVFASNR